MGRVSRLEWGAAAAAGLTLAVLVAIEPDIVEAPFQSSRAVIFTFGGMVLGLVALAAMIRFGVPAPVRLAVVAVPAVAVGWWLLSPFFTDDVVDERFDTTIEAAARAPEPAQPAEPTDTTAAPPAGPTLLASGSFVGLAGHDGEGDAGLFALPDGMQVLRFERFDIDNGPDLRLYVVPGADQRAVADGSLYLGRLEGNVGNQTYEIPAGEELGPGPWTVLVWCEAFSVEFVAATITV